MEARSLFKMLDDALLAVRFRRMEAGGLAQLLRAEELVAAEDIEPLPNAT